MDHTVAEALRVTTDVIHRLVPANDEQASALMEVSLLGQQLQDFLAIHAVQQECDVAALHKMCTVALSFRDDTLAAHVRKAMEAAGAATRAEKTVGTLVSQCLDRLSAVAALLLCHADVSTAMASEFCQQPQFRERAIEKEHLAAIQTELAQRAAQIVQTRGRCTLPPFSRALAALKAQAAQALNTPAPKDMQKELDELHRKVALLERRHAQGGQLQAVPLPVPDVIASAPPRGQQGSSFLERRACQPVDKSTAAAAAVVAGTGQLCRDREEAKALHSRQAERKLPLSVHVREDEAEIGPQSKALRGDAAPSTSTEGGNDRGGGGSSDRAAAVPSPLQQQQQQLWLNASQEREFRFPAPSTLPSPQKLPHEEEGARLLGPQVQQQAMLQNQALLMPRSQCDPAAAAAAAADDEGTGGREQEPQFSAEKENLDATQSQGNGSADAAAVAAFPPADAVVAGNAAEENAMGGDPALELPMTQPTAGDGGGKEAEDREYSGGEENEEERREAEAAQHAQHAPYFNATPALPSAMLSAPVSASRGGPTPAATRLLQASQRDSTSPRSNPAGSLGSDQGGGDGNSGAVRASFPGESLHAKRPFASAAGAAGGRGKRTRFASEHSGSAERPLVEGVTPGGGGSQPGGSVEADGPPEESGGRALGSGAAAAAAAAMGAQWHTPHNALASRVIPSAAAAALPWLVDGKEGGFLRCPPIALVSYSHSPSSGNPVAGAAQGATQRFVGILSMEVEQRAGGGGGGGGSWPSAAATEQQQPQRQRQSASQSRGSDDGEESPGNKSGSQR